MRRRPQARLADPALRAPPRGARDGGRPAARLAERPRRERPRDRRRARRGRARQADQLHGVGRRRLGAARACPTKAGQPRARQLDPGDRRGRRRPGRRRRPAGGERLLLRRAELHLGAAGLRAARRLRRVARALPAES